MSVCSTVCVFEYRVQCDSSTSCQSATQYLWYLIIPSAGQSTTQI